MRETACVVSFYRRRNIKVKKKKEIEEPLCMETICITFLIYVINVSQYESSKSKVLSTLKLADFCILNLHSF